MAAGTDKGRADSPWYGMSLQLTLNLTTNATSLLESEPGPTRSGSPDGLTTDPPGPEAAPASPSARQARERGLLTSSLASRLHQKLDSLGSTLFRLTWKVRVTPSGRLIYALRASARRISGNDCGSWPTTSATDWKSSGRVGQRRRQLTEAALKVPWPTPTVSTGAQTAENPTPGQTGGTSLPGAAQMAAWPTPNTMTGGQTSRGDRRKDELLMGGLVQSPDSGAMQNGSPAETGRRGQLNPALARWLMGLPPEWDDCAVTAMRSSHR